MSRFRKGEVWVLITTDLLARGVDFRGLNGVVNFDAPTSAAGYVHRVGRTGRAGRAGGVAVTFVAVVGEVPLHRLWHAVPSYPTISEVWLRLLETYGL